MRKTQFLMGFIIALSVLFVFLEMKYDHYAAAMVKALIVPSITVWYFVSINRRKTLFTLFLVLFSVSELLTFVGPYLPVNFEYYLGNLLYLIAYLCFVLGLLNRLNLRYVLKEFKFTLLILFSLNCYLLYVLYSIVSLDLSGMSIMFEFIYNTVVLFVLTFAFLNYLYRDNKKALLLFVGATCLVFSELIQYAFFYVAEVSLLNILGYAFFVCAFLFFYESVVIGVMPRLKTVHVKS
ncbi:hypothetical protein [Formosa sp. S-31]|uniref:hypothetical protein n=1 Tax=Formosa sp. S-31 TaxID=2790949 RepID=UPI003EBAB66B